MKKRKVSYDPIATYSVEILKEEEVMRDMSVIAVSANAMPKDIEKAIEMGFVKNITKPFKLKRFLGVIDEILRKC